MKKTNHVQNTNAWFFLNILRFLLFEYLDNEKDLIILILWFNDGFLTFFMLFRFDARTPSYRKIFEKIGLILTNTSTSVIHSMNCFVLSLLYCVCVLSTLLFVHFPLYCYCVIFSSTVIVPPLVYCLCTLSLGLLCLCRCIPAETNLCKLNWLIQGGNTPLRDNVRKRIPRILLHHHLYT